MSDNDGDMTHIELLDLGEPVRPVYFVPLDGCEANQLNQADVLEIKRVVREYNKPRTIWSIVLSVALTLLWIVGIVQSIITAQVVADNHARVASLENQVRDLSLLLGAAGTSALVEGR